eukprot:TRINITY_DN51633_c0_g1_i1.p1 TRINITY_DN51633_c0_g1~~TRINITY_DN51633_c0_g1_i1.p1  ORF type:complete len:170 (-),score=1.91 TRINITY_DN51633_c0_g1_i1:2-511(-)
MRNKRGTTGGPEVTSTNITTIAPGQGVGGTRPSHRDTPHHTTPQHTTSECTLRFPIERRGTSAQLPGGNSRVAVVPHYVLPLVDIESLSTMPAHETYGRGVQRRNASPPPEWCSHHSRHPLSKLAVALQQLCDERQRFALCKGSVACRVADVLQRGQLCQHLATRSVEG